MKKTPLINLELDLYYEKLDNGLEIYVVPNLKVNNIYVTFTTKYGSNHSTFVPFKENKMVTVPDGIAHFLEHKMFAKPDNIDPFTFFSERGADANASTSNIKTTYMFSGPSFFEENLNYLLDYVQSPYFTDKNVEKEKGIIEQEIKMYLDDPYHRLYELSLYNSFEKLPYRTPVIGSISSIRSITKEDLYKCYNTFYHPSNMFVVITGNVSPEESIEIIKNNQIKKGKKEQPEIKIKKIDEPDKIYNNKDIISMDVSIPKVSLNYKFNVSNFNLDKEDIITYILLFFDIKLRNTSEFNIKMKKLGILNKILDVFYIKADNHLLFMVEADTNEPEKLIDNIKQELSDLSVNEEDFNRKKKVGLSGYITLSDSIYQLNSTITSDIINRGEVLTDRYNKIKAHNFEDMNKVIRNLSFENNGYVIIKPKTE